MKSRADLPKPPAGKTGWPWISKPRPLPEKMPNGKPWPKITIVTPSYNQAQFIEETIRSVLMQGYPNLEYIIVDGGSTDGSVDVIKKYEPCLSYWVSEKDRGQSHAINKGFERSTGEIMAWLNSDDIYIGNALRLAAEGLCENDFGLIYGKAIWLYANGKADVDTIRAPNRRLDYMANWISQPSAFWTRETWRKAGPIDESFFYCMDFDLWLRMLGLGIKMKPIDSALSVFRVHGDSKTFAMTERWLGEIRELYKRHAKTLRIPAWYIYHAIRPLNKTLSIAGRGYENKVDSVRRLAIQALLAPIVPIYGYDRVRHVYRAFFLHVGQTADEK